MGLRASLPDHAICHFRKTPDQLQMRSIEVSRDGNQFTDNIALEMFDTNGNVIGTGCGTTVATRFE
jgi:hypothetical protein